MSKQPKSIWMYKRNGATLGQAVKGAALLGSPIIGGFPGALIGGSVGGIAGSAVGLAIGVTTVATWAKTSPLGEKKKKVR